MTLTAPTRERWSGLSSRRSISSGAMSMSSFDSPKTCPMPARSPSPARRPRNSSAVTGMPGRVPASSGLPTLGTFLAMGRALEIPLETELGPDCLEPVDDVHDVLVERDTELCRALLDLVSRDLARESLVLHLLHHGSDVD